MTDTTLIARMNDLAAQATKRGCAHSKFLTAAEAEETRRAFQTRRDVSFILDGGFDDAERTVAVFLDPNRGEYAREDVLAALHIKHRKEDSLGHRDILGAALGLGIERAVLGDILIGGPCHLVCLADMADFICAELTQAGRVGITVTRVPLNDLPAFSRNVEERTDTVASLRLDAIVAAMFTLSRKDAVAYIEHGKVQLAHRLCENTSKIVDVGDVVSVRGLGRGKLTKLSGQSKKGRIWITFEMYV